MVQLIVAKSLESVGYDFIPPLTDSSLELWSFIGGSAAKSVANYAPSRLASSVIGAPTYSARYATLLPGVNQIQTQATQTADQTIIVVARPTVDGYTYLMSNNSGPAVSPPPPTTRGATLRFETGVASDGKVSLAFNQSIRDGSNVDQEAAVTKTLASNVGSFSFLVGRVVSATSVRDVKDWTTGQAAQATTTFATDLGTNPYIVGGAQTVTALFQNPVDIALVAKYARGLSDAEIGAIYAWARPYFANRGITI